MKVKPLTNTTPQTLHELRDKIQENKRLRAKSYRIKKRQREIECENNILSLKTQNKILKEEIARLRKEKEQMLKDPTYYMTYPPQPPTQTYHQEFIAQTYYPLQHRHPTTNGTWFSTRWNFEAIEGCPNTEALLGIQEDNRSDYEDNDVINNQETNPNKKQDKELVTFKKNAQ